MKRRATPTGPPAAREPMQSRPRPNLSGDLLTMLEAWPQFRRRLRGYDQLQVDNYVAWAENELQAVRHELDLLAVQLGACSAEREALRRDLVQSPRERELAKVSDRVRGMLQLAAEEAADVRAIAEIEAERVLEQARAEAAGLVERARDQARESEQSSNALAAQHLAVVQQQVDALRRQRNDLQSGLQRLAQDIGSALRELAPSGPSPSGPSPSGPSSNGPSPNGPTGGGPSPDDPTDRPHRVARPAA
jgi:cell division septum initiation protein DivIVA